MFLLWGKRLKRKKLGYVAEFCPVCRSIQQFEVTRLTQVGHFYLITIGKGQIVGFPSVCTVCGLELDLEAQNYLKIGEVLYDDIGFAINDTNPDIKKEFAYRLEVENRLKFGQTITSEERKELLDEPFEIYSAILEERYGRDTNFDKTSGMGCMYTVLLTFCLTFIPIFLEVDGKLFNIFFGPAAAITVIFGSIYTLYHLSTVHRKFVKAHVYPTIAKCLKILKPRESEIDEILGRYRTAGFKIGKVLKTERIMEELDKLKA